MKSQRNWSLIIILAAAIFAYEFFILGPYNRKNTPVVTGNTVAINAATPSMSSAAGSPLPQTLKKLGLSDADKGKAEKIEINDTRYFNVYPDGSIGDAVFTKYFQRGKAIKEPARIIENGFHWSASDPKVDACLHSFKKTSSLGFAGEAEGVKCSLTYKGENLLLGTKLELESTTEISGDVYFETEDHIGDGPQFDHRYLTFKKKEEKTKRIRDKALWTDIVKDSGPFDFISWGDKYFAAIILPRGRFSPDLTYKAGVSAQRVNWGITYPVKWSASSPKVDYDFDVYFAVKDFQELRSVRADLTDTVDFGFFGAIARFMLWCLEALNKVFGNYGIAIIILSLLIRLLLWPVNKKMFESGQKMKDIQPRMEAIKKKYEGKTDQMMQMNQEVRQLYSTAGVNPLGSCLPVVLQIPIFFSLNSALSNSVDLYQAPFFGWITDLSYKDPLFILPIIWTISLIISVELNPQPASQPGMPDMKWVSRVMFVVFGFISKDFPSGLNLYFLVSNLAGMAQQFLFKKKTQMAKQQNILIGKER
jgi:YidC/Oxa1 family membrane protein insertase